MTSKELNERIALLHQLPKELPQFQIDVKALIDTCIEAVTPEKLEVRDRTDMLEANYHRFKGINNTIDTIQANTKDLLG